MAGPRPPRPAVSAAGPTVRPRPPAWGWLEWTLLAQVVIPALLFIPGMSALRLVTRIAVFAVPLAAWVLLAGARPRPWARRFPAAPWLALACGWMLLSIAHPSTNSLLAGLAQLGLYAAVLCPAFWAASALESEVQVRRLMAILLLGNGASALVGIGQFYRPDLFNPPVITVFNSEQYKESLAYTTADGRSVMRPCGIGDSPGGACVAGMWAAVAGLAWALRPLAAWKRLACLGLSMAGLAVIYFTMVRSALILAVLGVLSLLGFLVLRRDFRRATRLAVAGALVFVVALAWVGRHGGTVVLERFGSLLEENAVETYQINRGRFLEETFHKTIWDYPVGAGMGRWGMMFHYFGNHAFGYGHDRGPLWAELQWTGWAYDGGIVLMIAFAAAMLAAMLSTIRIGLTCPDRELAFWAAVVWGVNFAVVFQTIGSVPFVTGAGVQFWLLAAALHAADARARWRHRAARAQARARPQPRPAPWPS